MRMKVADIAPTVDTVIGEQAARLASHAASLQSTRDDTPPVPARKPDLPAGDLGR